MTKVHDLSQSLATAITFGDIQEKRHPELEGFLVLRTHLRGFDIILYCPDFDLLLVSYFAWTTKALLILWTIGPLSTLPLSLYQLPASMGLFAQPEHLFSHPSVFSIVRHFLIGRSSVIRYTQCPFFITMVPSGHPGDRWSSIMSTKN